MANLKIALVCSSNQNRSMAAHEALASSGFDVYSYGTGISVKLPGPSLEEPVVYDFGVSYQNMYNDLKNKDPELYASNGVLSMLERNAKIKPAPERFLNCTVDLDIIITFEARVFDQVLDFYFNRPNTAMKLLHVFNLETMDTHTDAQEGARRVSELVRMLSNSDLCNDLGSVLSEFEHRASSKPLLYTSCFS
ncbi:hypothetical protein P9112_012206 [Eukaryota sp. TZLM1-RC]